MNQSTDDSWQDYWSSNGTFTFSPDQSRVSDLDQEEDIMKRLTNVYEGQNRLLRKVAEAVDAAWPPEEYTEDGMSPGDIVRQFIINTTKGERVE